MIIRTYKTINPVSVLAAMTVAKKMNGFVIIKNGIVSVKINAC